MSGLRLAPRSVTPGLANLDVDQVDHSRALRKKLDEGLRHDARQASPGLIGLALRDLEDDLVVNEQHRAGVETGKRRGKFAENNMQQIGTRPLDRYVEAPCIVKLPPAPVVLIGAADPAAEDRRRSPRVPSLNLGRLSPLPLPQAWVSAKKSFVESGCFDQG